MGDDFAYVFPIRINRGSSRPVRKPIIKTMSAKRIRKTVMPRGSLFSIRMN